MVDQIRGQEIKVQIPQLGPRPEPKPQYVYHWDRIIGALAALGLLIGLIAYGIYTWLTPSLPPASVEVEEVQRQEEILVGAAQQPKGAVQGPTPSLPAPGVAAADRQPRADVLAIDVKSPRAESDPPQSPVQPEPVFEGAPKQAVGEAMAVDLPRLAAAEAPPAELAEPAPAQTPVGEEIAQPRLTQKPVREEIAAPATAPTLALKSGEEQQPITRQGLPGEARPEPSAAVASDTLVEVGREPASETESGEAIAAADAPEKASGNGHFRSRNTSIASPAVKRFVLAQSVINNEPKGNLGDIIVNAESVAAVSSFSEVIGLEGEVLEYRWLHEGKQVLQIRVPVGAQRWRSHSTKRIYERMKGAWRAELRDSTGNLLASIDFVF